MRITSEIKSPNYFMSAPYEPGQMIDFTDPPAETDLDKSRNILHAALTKDQDLGIIVQEVNSYLMTVGITQREEDLQQSLHEFTQKNHQLKK